MAKKNTGQLFLGTSGYSYMEWKGSFYPEKCPATRFLEEYSQRLTTVEVNNTFYRFPKAEMFEKWRDQTPAGFQFSVKANQRITHRGRLKEVDESTRDFLERCSLLGDRLGAVLFQLPPNFKRDDDRLKDFLDLLPGEGRFVLEFRHESWFDDAVYRTLEEHGVCLCISEGEKLPAPRVATSSFGYVRLRKDAYGDEDLADWRQWFTEMRDEGRDVFAYLKHDTAGESPTTILSRLGDT